MTLQSDMQRIEAIRGEINVLRAKAKAILKGIENDLIGRTVQYGIGKMSGDYRIAYVRLNWDTQIEAHGRKWINGKLGTKTWDIGTLYPERIRVDATRDLE